MRLFLIKLKKIIFLPTNKLIYQQNNMRTNVVAGNWKMNKTIEEGIQLVKEIQQLLKTYPVTRSMESIKIILSPPFTLLKIISDLLKETPFINLAAQNCHSEEKGAFTGEISVGMIKSAGASYVIIGHSERRTYFNETDALLAKKIKVVLSNGLLPIYCCGEKLQERNAGVYFEVVKNQISEGLFHLPPGEFSKVVIAYEPVWAIGTGLNATPEQAEEMHMYIRSLIEEKYDIDVATDTSIIYGGSCNAKNARELFSNPDVDGGLIGGASLIAGDFVQIIHSA